jgi:hypothetical protein
MVRFMGVVLLGAGLLFLALLAFSGGAVPFRV